MWCCAFASPLTLAESMTRPEGMRMNRDTYGGAVHGLGKRGMGVRMADHGCADVCTGICRAAKRRGAAVALRAMAGQGGCGYGITDHAETGDMPRAAKRRA